MMILQTVLDLINHLPLHLESLSLHLVNLPINLESLQYLPLAFGFSTDAYEVNDRIRLINRLNTAPARPAAMSPTDPRRTTGFNLYRTLAQQTGPAPAAQIALRQQAFGAGNAADDLTRTNAVPQGGGNRFMNALRGAGQRFSAQQNLQGTSGNSIMDILRQNEQAKVKGLGAWSNLENAYGQARQKAGMDAYEQDIKRFAATMQAKASLGMPMGLTQSGGQ